MGASYTHTTRGAIVLTPEIYNADHQNHIDNAVPTAFDDYSSSIGQMQATTSPGEAGAESLATSLAGELERLRFQFKAINGKTHWYQKPYSADVAEMQSLLDPGEVGTETVATSLKEEIQQLRFMIKRITGKTHWYENPPNIMSGGGSEAFNLAGVADFTITGIPAGTRRVLVTLQGIDSSAYPTQIVLRLGTSAGLVTTLYKQVMFSRNSTTFSLNSADGAFRLAEPTSNDSSGHVQLSKGHENTWVSSSTMENLGAVSVHTGAGHIVLPGELDRVQVFLTSGTFVSGRFSIIQE